MTDSTLPEVLHVPHSDQSQVVPSLAPSYHPKTRKRRGSKGLSVMDRIIAGEYAHGSSLVEIELYLKNQGTPRTIDQIRYTLKRQCVKDYIEQDIQTYREMADKAMEHGVSVGAKFLTALVADEEAPWEWRTKAAFRLVDGNGRLGPVVQKTESKEYRFQASPEQMQKMLAAALADPGVRAFLPSIIGAEPSEPVEQMKPLPSEVAEEVVMGSDYEVLSNESERVP